MTNIGIQKTNNNLGKATQLLVKKQKFTQLLKTKKVYLNILKWDDLIQITHSIFIFNKLLHYKFSLKLRWFFKEDRHGGERVRERERERERESKHRTNSNLL